jgi:hypothetical protein
MEIPLQGVDVNCVAQSLEDLHNFEGNSEFSPNDIVLLIGDNDPVAKGKVFSVDAKTKCPGVVLGCDRISICVVEAYFDLFHLPYPNGGAENVGEAIGTIVLWDTSDVIPHMSSNNAENVIGMSGVDNCVHVEDDLTNQKNWYKKLAFLYGEDRVTLLAHGYVTNPHAQASVNDERVGDDHVGVNVLKVVSGNDEAKLKFLHYSEGSPCLVKWPISATKIPPSLQFLGDILHIRPEPLLQIETFIKRKRPYNNQRRNPMSDAEKERRKRELRKSKKLSAEEINSVYTKPCCGGDCCKKIHRDVVVRARDEFYGMSHNDKVTYVLNHLNGRDEWTMSRGTIVFIGIHVCKAAFSLIHGFTLSTFYNYIGQHEKGGKVGVHGNEGTKKAAGYTLAFVEEIRDLFNKCAEPMPHLHRATQDGGNKIVFRIPMSYDRKDVYVEVSKSLQLKGMKVPTLGTFYKLLRENFANYQFVKASIFAKCEVCTTIKEKLRGEKRQEEIQIVKAQRDKHMLEQQSRRSMYYAARNAAKSEPDKFLSIIHDKMDQAKTGIPKMTSRIKSMATGCVPLPIALTGMLTHGRQPGAFAHFSLTGLWPGDPDFTISSMALLFRDLESYSGDKTGDLVLQASDTNVPIFKALLQRDAFETGYLQLKKISMEHYKGKSVEPDQTSQVVGTSTTFRPLPRHLLLQLDNSGKDNKNQTVMAFCSQLVLRGVFETITVSFLMVGHTHEDVDALFSRVGIRIYNKELATLFSLMAEVWECTSKHPVPRFIQEVAAYKAYIGNFVKRIEGQSAPVQFLFSMKNNIPVYQYRDSIKGEWLPTKGKSLWKDTTFPQGDPFSKPMSTVHKRSDEIIPYLRSYVNFLKHAWKDDRSEGYHQRLPEIKYWENVIAVLQSSLIEASHNEENTPLRDGFWPSTNHGTGFKVVGTTIIEDTVSQEEDLLEDLEREVDDDEMEREAIYVGPRSEKEVAPFIPLQDIHPQSFVIIRPSQEFHDKIGGRFWLAKATSAVTTDRNNKHCGQFQLEWWRPKNKKQSASDQERYANCFEPNQVWERDPGFIDEPSQWMEATSTFFGWKSRSKSLATSTKISSKRLKSIQGYIVEIDSNE